MSNTPVPINPKVQPYKNVDITTNGDYEVVPDDPYNCIKKVDVNVNLPITSGSVIFEPQGVFDYRNTYYASGTPWSALTVDAQQFGDSQYWAGYRYAQDNIGAEAVELSVSANGIYNATIGQQGEGYIKKVTVNVPSSGVTEPFFGKWADFTNVGFTLSLSSAATSYIEIECLAPYGTEIFHWLNPSGESPTYYGRFYTYFDPDLYSLGTARIYGVSYSGSAPQQDWEYCCDLNRPVKGSIYAQYPPDWTAHSISVQGIVATTALTGQTIVSQHLSNISNNVDVLSGIDNIRFFYRYSGSVETICEKVNYFKSLRIYDASNNVTKYILPRSDGKMWDVIANQESDIDWIKSDGTHPKIFNTLYEWDIPTV